VLSDQKVEPWRSDGQGAKPLCSDYYRARRYAEARWAADQGVEGLTAHVEVRRSMQVMEGSIAHGAAEAATK
jgi:hypothetical protein